MTLLALQSFSLSSANGVVECSCLKGSQRVDYVVTELCPGRTVFATGTTGIGGLAGYWSFNTLEIQRSSKKIQLYLGDPNTRETIMSSTRSSQVHLNGCPIPRLLCRQQPPHLSKTPQSPFVHLPLPLRLQTSSVSELPTSSPYTCR